MDYQQLDIFSYLQPQLGEPSILLSKGQTVYLSNKADVIKWRVLEKGGGDPKSHDGIILAGDIKPICTVAYSYIRDCDNRKMTAFYCDLGDGMYYIKEFMTFHHITKDKKASKKFMEQQEFKYGKPKEIDCFVPHFKNMYKCTEQSNWDYAECEYTYAVG